MTATPLHPSDERVAAALAFADRNWVDDSYTCVLAAKVRGQHTELEQLRNRVADLEQRDHLARQAAQLWADAWRHRHDAPDDEQAERGDQLEAALDAVAAAHGIEVQR